MQVMTYSPAGVVGGGGGGQDGEGEQGGRGEGGGGARGCVIHSLFLYSLKGFLIVRREGLDTIIRRERNRWRGEERRERKREK